MAEIVLQNPGSSEVQSPLVAGLTEGLWAISKVLNLTVENIENEPLKAVSIDSQEQNKNRIYEVNFKKKLWLTSPQPIIKKNGVQILQTTTPFTIDYIGGSVTFEKNLSDLDQITVTCQHIAGNSTTINTITNMLTEVSLKTDRYKGYFDTVGTLESEHETGKSGEFAFVEKPMFAIFAWDNAKKKWRNTQSIEDLTKYYTKQEIDGKLNGKENTISPTGKARDYYAGDKTFKALDTAVRETRLDGFAKGANSPVVASDTLLSAFGKLQGQLDGKTSYIKGTGVPTNSTKGDVGQRYINTSNGDWYTCVAASAGSYTWEKGQNAQDGMGLYPTNKVPTDNNFSTPEKQKLEGLKNYDDSQIKAELSKTVKNINGRKPDSVGNVDLKPKDIGALGLNEPATNSERLGGRAPEEYAPFSSVNVYNCTFLANGWTQSTNTWVQTVNCTGMKATYDTGSPWIEKSGDKLSDEKSQYALNKINNGYLETFDGEVKATLYTKPPKTNVTIYLRRAIKQWTIEGGVVLPDGDGVKY